MLTGAETGDMTFTAVWRKWALPSISLPDNMVPDKSS